MAIPTLAALALAAPGALLVGPLLSEPFAMVRGAVVALLIGGAVGLCVVSADHRIPARTLSGPYLVALFAGYFYQLALLRDVPDGASLFRILYYLIVLGGLSLFAVRSSVTKPSLLLMGAWLLLNLVPLAGPRVHTDVIGLYLVGVALPATSFLVVQAGIRDAQSLLRLSRSITVGLITLMTGLLFVMTVATSVRGYGSLTLARNASDLNYGVGLIFLAWPFLFYRFRDRSMMTQAVTFLIILLALILSFSRVALFAGLPLILLTLLRLTRGARRSLVMVLMGSVLLASLLVPGDAAVFWEGRLNVESWRALITPDADTLQDVIATNRGTIWRMALNAFAERPITGHGLGSFPALVSEETNGAEEYSGAHNLLLTVLAERGLGVSLFIVLLLLAPWFRAAFWWRMPDPWREFWFYTFIGFTAFLIAAHTGGAELIRPGTMFVDSIVTVLIMVYVALMLTRTPRTRDAFPHG